MRFFRPGQDVAVQKKQLLDAIDALDKRGVVYHLEGGTLLGIVRDGQLLPWDHDTDISIMHDSIADVKAVCQDLQKLGWRLTLRSVNRQEPFAKPDETRLLKIKDRFLYFLAGNNTLDIFVKFPFEGNAYWIAAGNVMAVPMHHYEGYKELDWEGRKVKVPVDYEGYLEAKYGDWRTPIKDWHCDSESTIVKPRTEPREKIRKRPRNDES